MGTFIESISVADMEKIHSQIIAFIFSDECTCISFEDKKMLLVRLFGINDLTTNKIICHTEYSSIDILIETDSKLFVIENKLKSNQHSDQLNEYIEKIKSDKNFNSLKRNFGFLTFVEEEANAEIQSIDENNDYWINISYKHFYELIHDIEVIDTYFKPFIIDYKRYLERLISVLNGFDGDHKRFWNVFTDASLKKYDKKCKVQKHQKSHSLPQYDDDMLFISRNKLESILQWRFFKRNIEQYLGRKSIKYELKHDEKHKSTLVWEIVGANCKILLNRSGNGGNVVMDILWGDIYIFDEIEWVFCYQFQGSTIKFGFHAKEYDEVPYNKIPPEVKGYFEKTLIGTNGHGRFNNAKEDKKTFISLTKTYKLYEQDLSTIQDDIFKSYNEWQKTYKEMILPQFGTKKKK